MTKWERRESKAEKRKKQYPPAKADKLWDRPTDLKEEQLRIAKIVKKVRDTF